MDLSASNQVPGRFRLLVAFGVDFVLFFSVLFVLPNGDIDSWTWGLVAALTPLWLFSGLFLSSAYGWSPGKRLVGVAIVDQQGNAPGFQIAWRRFCALYLSFLLFGLGFLVAWRHPDRRAWHDRRVGTYIVVGSRPPFCDPVWRGRTYHPAVLVFALATTVPAMGLLVWAAFELAPD